MIVKIEEIHRVLESKGFIKDTGEPFLFTEYSDGVHDGFIIDDEYYFADTDMLIEDLEMQGASVAANILREWVQAYPT